MTDMKCRKCDNFQFVVDETYPDKLIFKCTKCFQEHVLRYEKK